MRNVRNLDLSGIPQPYATIWIPAISVNAPDQLLVELGQPMSIDGEAPPGLAVENSACGEVSFANWRLDSGVAPTSWANEGGSSLSFTVNFPAGSFAAASFVAGPIWDPLTRGLNGEWFGPGQAGVA